MATIPSNFTRFQTSSPGTPTTREVLVTSVLQPRKPASRQSEPKLFTVPNEPEDARLTGGTRSLDRRLLALNLYGSRAQADAA